MEVDRGSKNKFIVCVYEALGTGFLLFAISMSTSDFGKFGIAFMVFAMILICGPVTGAHFNPAVTLGVFISNKHWREDLIFCLMIMLSQFIGGFWGVCLAWCSLYNPEGESPTKANVPSAEVVVLGKAPTLSWWNVFQIEAFCTCIFVLTILLVKTQRTSPTKHGLLGAFTVATTLLTMIILAGPRTGGCFNPAVGVALTTFDVINFGGSSEKTTGYFMYTLAPWCGAALSGVFHRGHLSCYKLFNDAFGVAELQENLVKDE
jgi:glycerol uptake facilitator-like aquaporin